jgi:hypothetical protein
MSASDETKGATRDRKVFTVTRRPAGRVLGCREFRERFDWLEAEDLGLVADGFGGKDGVRGLEWAGMTDEVFTHHIHGYEDIETPGVMS